MGRQSPEISPSWLDPEKLMEFIDELKHEAHYNIGVSQYIAAQDLILALTAKGEEFNQPERLKSFLGPLLCSSPAEQEDFQERFDQWIERMGFTVSKAVLEEEKAQEFKRELKKIERRSRRFLWVLVGIAIPIIIALINSLIQELPSSTNGVKPPPNGNNIFVLQEWQITLLWLLLVPLVIFLAWRLWWFWRAHLYLKRRATKRKPEIQRVSFLGFDEELFPKVVFLRIAQDFKRRIRVPSPELDVDKTVEETVREGGQFKPVYAYRQVLPEYLVLIDRANYGDHQARFVKEMIGQLTHNEVFIKGYYFDSDPRVCFSMTGKEPPRKLYEIAAKYSQHRLLIFSEADGLFSSLTGELEPWLDLFSSWSERAVLTPKPPENWGYQELELSHQFIILPATDQGLKDLIRTIQSGESSYAPSEEIKTPLPEPLRVRSQRWIERDAPEPSLVAEVLESLRSYLGEAGYYWFSACAVFPELHWNLTICLGSMLKTEDGETLFQPRRLNDLARLPWFRHGYMPDWLRSLLIYKMPRQQEDEVRKLLRNLLLAKPDEQGLVGKFQLEIAQKHSNVVSMLAQPLIDLLSRQSSDDSPLRDYIFQEFMTGRKRLAVQMPEELRNYLHRQEVGWRLWLQWMWANFWGVVVGFFVALAVASAVGFAASVFVALAVIAVVVGLAQWLVLRKRFAKSVWWILATFVGVFVGSLLGGIIVNVVIDIVVAGAVGGAVGGAVVGLAQWLVIRKRFAKSVWWILANVLSLAVGNALGWPLGFTVDWYVGWFLVWGIYGVITGAALIWLLRQSPIPRQTQPHQLKLNNYTETLARRIKLEMVAIPAGEFMMGSNDGYDNEKPVHKVKLKAFYMSRYLITQAQYQAIMGENPSYFKGKNNPVELVSWHDAQEFCQKLSQQTGKKYQLPSEAQWEYACRVGSTTKYCFGDDEKQLGKYAWYYGNSNNKTHPVGQKKPNQWGLHDMHGNVWEWCEDDYVSSYHNTPRDGSAYKDKKLKYIVLRGGSFVNYPDGCRSASRDYYFARDLILPQFWFSCCVRVAEDILALYSFALLPFTFFSFLLLMRGSP